MSGLYSVVGMFIAPLQVFVILPLQIGVRGSTQHLFLVAGWIEVWLDSVQLEVRFDLV